MKAWTFAVVPAVSVAAAAVPVPAVVAVTAGAVAAVAAWAPAVCCSDCRMLLNNGDEAEIGIWPMVTPLVLPNGPDVLVADAEVMGALVPWAPLRWTWNDDVDMAVEGAEEIALRLMRDPS